jgi:hypothetical protein
MAYILVIGSKKIKVMLSFKRKSNFGFLDFEETLLNALDVQQHFELQILFEVQSCKS